MTNTLLSEAYATFDSIADICQRYNPAEFQPIHRMITEKRQSPSASIMVYGVYNAGKSTMINALLGEDGRASVADKPETARISSYRWGEYEILDTPGIDAPIEHEAVTREQLYSADAVIFVVNPLGIVEEFQTLNALLELLERKKKVFVVLNCKNRLDPGDAELIKNELRKRIQMLAEKKELNSILFNIPIIEVNAKSALKAKIEGKENLLNSSGFPRFEADLNAFLASIDDKTIIANTIFELSKFLESTLIKIDTQTNDSTIEKIDNFFEEISKRQITLRSVLKSLIDAKTSFIEKKSFSVILANPEIAQSNIESIIQLANTEIFNELEVELGRLSTDTARLLNTMQESITTVSGSIALPKVEFAAHSSSDQSGIEFAQSNGVDPATLQIGLQQLAAIVKPDHLVEAMKLGKDLMPTLFKGVGPATMGKIASNILGKAVPVINAVLAIWQVGKGLFGTDPEEARILAEERQRELAEERRKEAVRDASENIAWEFKTAITKTINENIHNNFTEVNNSLTKIRESFGNEQRILSQDRAQVAHALAKLQNHA